MRGFYSPINQLAEQMARPKGTGAEFMTELSKKPGFKQAEVEDRNLQALQSMPKMSRDDFIANLKAQRPTQPEEAVNRGEDTHHEEYTLPGGTNYREILLQHPHGSFPGVGAHFGGAPNILASMRVKDRVSPEGKKILHIEEIQSDWHKKGSKKGYAPIGEDLHDTAKQAERAYNQLQAKRKEASAGAAAWGSKHNEAETEHQRDMAKRMLSKYNSDVMDLSPQVMKAEEAHRVAKERAHSAVPDAPFKKNWHELALKRMIQHAAEQGHYEIHITPGETQARRWGAEGEGAKGFHDLYNKQIPQFLNKFGKQFGAQVRQGEIETGGYKVNRDSGDLPYRVESEHSPDIISRHATPDEAWAHAEKLGMAPTHRFDITPEMREHVLKHGMPLYNEGGSVDRDEGLKKFLESSTEKRRMYHGTRHYTRGVPGGHPITSPEADPNYTENMRSTGGFKAITPGIRGMSFVTPDTEFANEYAGESKQSDKMSGAVYPVHVQVKHPFDYENLAHVRAVAKLLKPTDDKWAMHYGKNPQQIHDRLASGAWEYIEDPHVQAAAKKLGHDAMYMSEHGVKNLGVFNPNAIKSAIGNRGTYDVNEPDINKAKGGLVNDYRGDHKAPNPANGSPLHNVAKGAYPEDFYASHGFRSYVDTGRDYDQANYQKVKNAKNNPEYMVLAHRAVPSDVYQKSLKHSDPLIRPGDWVTLEKQYAKDHGEHALKGDYKIASMRVPAKHLYTNGDSLHEWGYHPTQVVDKAKGRLVSRETVKPIAHGIIKERVTVSPDMDTMQYELMKHITKKVK